MVMRIVFLAGMILSSCPVLAQMSTDTVIDRKGDPEVKPEDTDSTLPEKRGDVLEQVITDEHPYGLRRAYVRRKGMGYRIQIFTGGNSRSDRVRANRMGSLCREYFPELSVYPHFESPRWICRVGDFKTSEDAKIYVQKMRKLKVFKELRIVKSVVWQYW